MQQTSLSYETLKTHNLKQIKVNNPVSIEALTKAKRRAP
jgi:hypothetical protein